MKEVKMRRYQNLLTISGLGVIAFAVWSVMKTIMLFAMRKELLIDVLAASDDMTFKVTLISILVLILLVDFLVRLYVGLSARAEGFGKKKGYVYIIFAILLALTSLGAVVMTFFNISPGSSVAELVVSVIVEATSIVVVIELLVASFNVKKLRKELTEVQ